MTTYHHWDDTLIPLITSAMAAEDLTHYSICCGFDRTMERCLSAAIDDQPIDSHLEAVAFTVGTQVRHPWIQFTEFGVTAETLPTLIRRLAEPLLRHWEETVDDDDIPELGFHMQQLACDILGTLGISAEIAG